jgi:hypothetical protein
MHAATCPRVCRYVAAAGVTVLALASVAACGSAGQAHSGPASEVRLVIARLVAAERSDDGQSVCSALTEPAQQILFGVGLLHRRCGPAATAELKSLKWSETRGAAERAVASGSVVVRGDQASETARGKDGRSTVALTLTHGQWRVIVAAGGYPFAFLRIAGAVTTNL